MLLGVLKAGGAYLPLDPDHPAERLAAMLEDSGATVLVTEDHLRGRLPGCPPLVVALDPLADRSRESSRRTPSVRVDGENLAYVVFTSGSTGRPKGVMVSHRGLLAAAAAWEHAYDLRRPPLRHLQAAGFAFDVFTGDWVRALTTGGTLVACPRPVLLDPAALADLIRRERIECLELVPALADALATHLERQGEDLGGVRLLAVGSDTVRGRLYRRLCRLVEARRPGGQLLRPDRGDDRQHLLRRAAGRPRRRGRPGPDRPPVARDADVRPGRAWRAGSGGCGRRAVHRRARAWRGATSPIRVRRPSGSYRTRTASRARGCTRPATVRGGVRKVYWSCWAGETGR